MLSAIVMWLRLCHAAFIFIMLCCHSLLVLPLIVLHHSYKALPLSYCFASVILLGHFLDASFPPVFLFLSHVALPLPLLYSLAFVMLHSGSDTEGGGALGSPTQEKLTSTLKVPRCGPVYATVCCTTPGHVITSFNS